MQIAQVRFLDGRVVGVFDEDDVDDDEFANEDMKTVERKEEVLLELVKKRVYLE